MPRANMDAQTAAVAQAQCRVRVVYRTRRVVLLAHSSGAEVAALVLMRAARAR